MDALIMAAGRGSRLGEQAGGLPKSLVDLGGITSLELQLEILAQRGIERTITVVGYQAETVRGAASRRVGDRMALDFVFNPFWSVTNVLGSAWFARTRLRSDVVYLHADTVFEPSILDDALDSRADIALPIDLRECEPEQMKAEVQGGRVTYLSKELAADRTSGEFIGIGVFQRRAVTALKAAIDAEIKAGSIGAYFEAAINRLLVDDRLKAAAIDVRGRAWTEIDFPDDLAAARSQLPRLIAGTGLRLEG